MSYMIVCLPITAKSRIILDLAVIGKQTNLVSNR